jgi:hypothetical protein
MPQKVFIPLNGEELKKMILKEVEKDLDLDTDFRQHITYPTVEWEWTLKLTCQQRTPATLEKQIAGAVVTVNPETKRELPLPPDAKPVSKIRGRGKSITVPDKERAAANMPVLSPKHVEGVGVVDVPGAPRTESARGGRGVTIKNRASVGFRLDE